MLGGIHFTTHSDFSESLSPALSLSPQRPVTPESQNAAPAHLSWFSFSPSSYPSFFPCGLDLMISALNQPKTTLTQGLTHESVSLPLPAQSLVLCPSSLAGHLCIWAFPEATAYLLDACTATSLAQPGPKKSQLERNGNQIQDHPAEP